jgi:hypothetical protein
VQAYTSPFQHQQQQQAPVQSPQPALVPNFAAWGMNDATAQFGILGHTAVAAGQDYVQKNVGTHPAWYELFELIHDFLVWSCDPIFVTQVSFQRVKFVCYSENSPRAFSVDAQAMVSEKQAIRTGANGVATST